MLIDTLTSRLLSFAILSISITFLSERSFIFYTSVIGIAHYIVALLFSSTIIKAFLKNESLILRSFLILIALFVFSWLKVLPMVLFFGVHHLFSELYTEEKIQDSKIDFKNLILILFHGSFYCLFAKNEPIFSFIPPKYYYWIFFIIAPYYLYLTTQNNQKNLKKYSTFSIYIAIAVISFYFPLKAYYIIFYHFIFWFFYPTSNLLNKSKYDFVKYLIIMVVTILIVYFIYQTYLLDINNAFYHLYVLGYLHITLSFFLSKLNPQIFIKYLLGQK